MKRIGYTDYVNQPDQNGVESRVADAIRIIFKIGT